MANLHDWELRLAFLQLKLPSPVLKYTSVLTVNQKHLQEFNANWTGCIDKQLLKKYDQDRFNRNSHFGPPLNNEQREIFWTYGCPTNMNMLVVLNFFPNSLFPAKKKTQKLLFYCPKIILPDAV